MHLIRNHLNTELDLRSGQDPRTCFFSETPERLLRDSLEVPHRFLRDSVEIRLLPRGGDLQQLDDIDDMEDGERDVTPNLKSS